MNEVLVSVIIPVYGEGRYLERALESVLNQSYTDLEIIVVDDNGIESINHQKIVEIMSRYADNPKIKLISHDINKNGAAARNTGVKNAKGKYIGLLDDDDIYHTDNIKTQISVLEGLDETYALTYCSNEVYENGKKISEAHVWKDGHVFEDILTANIEICTSALLIKKSAYDSIGGFDESFRRHQDLEFLVRISNKYKVRAIDYIGFRRYITNRNNAKNPETFEANRLHYLKKIGYIIESLPEERQSKIYDMHYAQIGKEYFKARKFKKSLEWAKKTSNAARCVKHYFVAGFNYLKRKFL